MFEINFISLIFIFWYHFTRSTSVRASRGNWARGRHFLYIMKYRTKFLGQECWGWGEKSWPYKVHKVDGSRSSFSNNGHHCRYYLWSSLHSCQGGSTCFRTEHYYFRWSSLTKFKSRECSSNIEGEPPSEGFLSVISKGGAYDFQVDKLGVYRLTDETHNGKPTWRYNHSDPFSRPHFIFYHGRVEILLKSFNTILWLQRTATGW